MHACCNTFCRVCIDNYMRVPGTRRGCDRVPDVRARGLEELISAANLETLQRPRERPAATINVNGRRLSACPSRSRPLCLIAAGR